MAILTQRVSSVTAGAVFLGSVSIGPLVIANIDSQKFAAREYIF